MKTFEYHGFEDILDMEEDIMYCKEIPDGEFQGTVKITVEYIPPVEETKEE